MPKNYKEKLAFKELVKQGMSLLITFTSKGLYFHYNYESVSNFIIAYNKVVSIDLISAQKKKEEDTVCK